MQFDNKHICTESFAVVLAGDIIPTHSVSDHLEKNSLTLSEVIRPLFHGQVFFANFEGVLTEQQLLFSPQEKKRFRFQAHPRMLDFFNARFPHTIFSFANNHSFDYGMPGVLKMLQKLPDNVASVGIGETHKQAMRAFIIGHNEVRLAFLGFTDLLPEEAYASSGKPGIARLTLENLRDAIHRVRRSADAVIVALHTVSDITKAFSFWPDRHQKMLGKYAIDSGADIVVGHQPHGLQFAERYKNGTIFHSLGALLYAPELSQTFSVKHPLWGATQAYGGAIVKMLLCKHGIYTFTLVPTKMIKNRQQYGLVRGSWPQRLLAELMQ